MPLPELVIGFVACKESVVGVSNQVFVRMKSCFHTHMKACFHTHDVMLLRK